MLIFLEFQTREITNLTDFKYDFSDSIKQTATMRVFLSQNHIFNLFTAHKNLLKINQKSIDNALKNAYNKSCPLKRARKTTFNAGVV